MAIVSFYKPNLPDKDIYQEYISQVWNSAYLTNNGKFVQLLEQKLSEYLRVKHVVLVSSGTIALQVALRAADIKGTVLTTPFSFIASTSAALWQNCDVIFKDIDTSTLQPDFKNTDTNGLDAILPVQIFGLPVNIDTYSSVSVPIIIDGAHSFGVFENDVSILSQSNLSVISLHSTKLFHTVEGGAVITDDDNLAERIKSMRNFGFNKTSSHIEEIGINAKMSELHAAMGLSLLNNVDNIKERNKWIFKSYNSILKGNDRLLYMLDIPEYLDYHYAYFPVIFYDKNIFEQFITFLTQNNIGYKRYFQFPLNKLSFFNNHQECPNTESICERIVCLPIYYGLLDSEVDYICSKIRSFLHSVSIL